MRLFAALREAAGVSELEVPAAPLDVLLAGLRERFGGRFSEVLACASVLVDGQRRAEDSSLVADGSEIALLPPFSGG